MNIATNILEQYDHLVPINVMRRPHLIALLDKSVISGFEPDECIFKENETHTDYHFIVKGEVILSHISKGDRLLHAASHQLPIIQFNTKEFSAKAKTQVSLLTVDREVFESLLTWSQVADYLEVEIAYRRELDNDADWMQTVLNSNLFYKIPPLNVADIFACLKTEQVNQGERVINEGDQGDRCFFIKSGSAIVTKRNADGTDAELARIGIGRCFGEDALIHSAPRNASVTMAEDGQLMMLKKQDFVRLLKPVKVDSLQLDSLSDTDDASYIWLDVRSQQEFHYRHIHNAVHIPLNILRLKTRILDPNKTYRVYCNSGQRSLAAAFLLEKKGFKVSVLDEGLSTLSSEQVNELLESGEQIFDKGRVGQTYEG